jgi:[ribosomal protein S5]-alanine N-acetyltransferase
MVIPPLVTPRLLVRPFRMNDHEATHRLYAGLADANLGHSPLASPEQTRAWLTWSVLNHDQLAQLNQPPYGDLAVVLRATGELVGVVGNVPALAPFGQIPALRGDANEAASRLCTCELALFWAIHPDHRRRGYAREAASALIEHDFQHLGLRRIVAITAHDNLPSQAVMRSLSMHIERNPRADPPWLQVVGILNNEALREERPSPLDADAHLDGQGSRARIP